MTKIELLSPVGSLPTLAAAIYNGADAVYLGSKLFNARRLAGNFTTEELKKAIQFAHLHEVKVYVTLNTLIKNHELIPFLNQISQVAQFKADAVILQDLCFAPLIKKNFPMLQIHASTQATIMNSPSIKFWQKYVDLFVLARELTKPQVQQIFQKTHARLEIFAHGHLCISYSGQCLISSLIGKRSGNRGLCASSCRKQYNGNSYLLSAKDLCLIENIPDLVESGVKTIKIEGRMKSPEYVATTTKLYRQQLDSYYNHKKAHFSKLDFNDLKLTFNREFTSGYFNQQASIVDPVIPSKRGIYLGTVRNGWLQLNEEISLFDGVSTVNKGKREGDFIKKIITASGNQVTKASKGQVIKLLVPGFVNGAKVYLLSQHQGSNLLGEFKPLSLSLYIEIKQESKAKAIITVNSKNHPLELIYYLKSTAAPAINQPLRPEAIQRQLNKFHSLIFNIEKLDIKTDCSFIPNSDFTAFRAELETLIMDQLAPIARDKKNIELPIFSKTSGTEKKLYVRVYSKYDAVQAVAAGADVICYDAFEPDLLEVANLVKGKALFYLHTPMALNDTDLGQLSQIIALVNPSGLLANNVGVLSLGFPGQILLGYQMNIFNDLQLDYYRYPAIASIELNLSELSAFADKEKLVYYAHGRPVVMTFKEKFNAVQLTDKKCYTFRLRKTKLGYTEMLYSKTIALLQNTKKILSAGITQLYLDLEQDVYATVDTYKKLLSGKSVSLQKLRKNATKGNLEKGVM